MVRYLRVYPGGQEVRLMVNEAIADIKAAEDAAFRPFIAVWIDGKLIQRGTLSAAHIAAIEGWYGYGGFSLSSAKGDTPGVNVSPVGVPIMGQVDTAPGLYHGNALGENPDHHSVGRLIDIRV